MANRKGKATARNVVECAKHFGAGTRTVHHWVERGCPRNPDGSFDLEAVAEWCTANNNRGGSAEEKAVRVDILKLKRKQLSLEVGEQAGEMISVEVVESIVRRQIAMSNTHLRQIPDEILALLPESIDKKQIREAVESRLNNSLRELSETLSALAYELEMAPQGDEEGTAAE